MHSDAEYCALGDANEERSEPSEQEEHPSLVSNTSTSRRSILLISWPTLLTVAAIISLLNFAILYVINDIGQIPNHPLHPYIRVPIELESEEIQINERYFQQLPKVEGKLQVRSDSCNEDDEFCQKLKSLFPRCKTKHPQKFFNKRCNEDLNTEECGFDNGACKGKEFE